MDNITQGVIGGSLFALITGKKTNKYFFLGAGIANIPDLDVFIGRLIYSDPVDVHNFHRGIMHSLIFVFGLSLILSLFHYFRVNKEISYWRLLVGYLVSIIFGHILIDGMTSYGMRYFLPRLDTTYSRDNIFVVDFGMRTITIIGMIIYLLSTSKAKIATRILGSVGLYILFSFGMQQYMNNQFIQNYNQEIVQKKQKSITMATPLQLFLRRHIIKTDNTLYEGELSLFDLSRKINWQESRLDTVAMNEIQNIANPYIKKQINTLLSSTRGMVQVVKSNSGYLLNNFIFGKVDPNSERSFGYYIIGTGNNYEIIGTSNPKGITKKVWNDFWNRVWGE